MNLFAVGALVFFFTPLTWGNSDNCYSGGNKFSDLLDDAQLKGTIADFCQDHGDRPFKNGEMVRKIGSEPRFPKTKRLEKQCNDRQEV